MNDWSVCGAKSRGPRHVLTGTPCQDAFRHGASDKLTVLALADGSGSSSVSQAGSRIAARTSVNFLLKQDPDFRNRGRETLQNLVVEAISDAARRVRSLSRIAGRDIRDFASTLSLVAVTETDWVVATIGDSPVVVETMSEGLATVARGADHEFASETDFLTGADWREHIATAGGSSDDLVAVALMSDGMGFCTIDASTDIPSPGFFRPLFDAAHNGICSCSDLEAVLDSDEARVRSDDDKALVLAVRWVE